MDIVDSSVFEIVGVDISWVKVGVFFDAVKFSPADVTALILHFRHLKKRHELFFLTSVNFLELFVYEACVFGVCSKLAGIATDPIYFFTVFFPVFFLTGVWLRG